MPSLPAQYEILLTGEKLSGAVQRDVIFWIHNLTTGANPTREWIRLSNAQLAELCVTDRSGICRAVQDLERRGLIARKAVGPYSVNAKCYKLTPENWSNAQPYRSIAASQAVASSSSQEKHPLPGGLRPPPGSFRVIRPPPAPP